MSTGKSITRAAVAVFIAGAAAFMPGCGKREAVAKRKAEPIVLIEPVPPPPPPPPPQKEPPPPPPEEKEPEMVQQEEIKEVTEPDPAPVDEPPALGTNMTPGNGPDSGYGLSKGGGTGGGNGRGANGGNGGGRFDRYAVLLQNTLAGELRRNAKTRASSFNVDVTLRIDSEGRISSLKPKSSTGDPSLDQALRNDFIGVRFSEPPPADMPMPIHTRLTGRKR